MRSMARNLFNASGRSWHSPLRSGTSIEQSPHCGLDLCVRERGALGGVPNKAQVGDMGIDGRIFPVSAAPKREKDAFDFMNVWYPIRVKQRDKVGRPDIDSFQTVLMREDCTKGFFVGFSFSSDALTGISAFFKRTGKVTVPLTVKEILDEQIAMKLA